MKRLLLLLSILLLAGCSSTGNSSSEYSEFESENSKSKQEEQTEKDYLKDEEKALKAAKLSDCSSIQLESLRFDCEFTVIANNAISDNDISQCAEINDSSLESACEDAFNAIYPESI